MHANSAWPAVPRPMPQEVFGSWLGRVAGRFGIGVDELVAASRLDIELGPEAKHWLAARPTGAEAALRLGHLARLSRQEQEQMLDSIRANNDGYPCCFRCLVLNPWEVESPYWRLEWMRGQCACDHDASLWEWASPGLLKQAANMSRLVQALGRRRQRRRSGC